MLPRFFSTVALALLTAASSAAAAASPAPDAPYEEVLSLRRPFAGAWPPAQLPSGWRPLPCGSLAPTAAATAAVGALFLCGGGSGGGGGSGAAATTALFSASLDTLLTARGDALPPPAALATSALAASPDGAAVFLLVPGASALFALDCSEETLDCNVTAVALPSPLPPGVISGSAVYASVTRPGAAAITVWAAGPGAVAAFDVDVGARQALLLPGPGSPPFAYGASAVAHSAALGEVALGNASKVVYLDDASLATRWWDWVTDIPSGDGGVYDDAITALIYDDASGGVLYAGSQTCINVRTPLGVVTRVAAHEGLPWGNVTSLALNVGYWPRTRLWVGTSRGVLLFDPGAASQYGGAVGDGNELPLQQRFRYFYGPRYLSANSPADAFSGSAVSAIAAVGASAFVASSGGLAMLEGLNVTLLDKVRAYEARVPAHSRLGQVSGCDFATFGVVEGCVSGTDDNDGLW